MKQNSPTDLVVLMAGVGVGMVLGWVFGREWLSRKAESLPAAPEHPPSRLLAQLRGCLEVERN